MPCDSSPVIPSTPLKIRINGINVYYELHGKGKPIVLIAGFSCDHLFWSGVLDELSKHHQVLLFDNRGIGQTDAPDSAYTIDMMADDVMGLIKALGIKSPTIVGQSMGSAIAQNIGKRYGKEVNNLVLINTFTRLSITPEIVFNLTGELHRIDLPLKYRVQIIAPWVFSSEFLSQPDQLHQLIQLAENNPYPQTLVGYQRQLDALRGFDSRPWLHEIPVPALVIAAEKDLIAPLVYAQEVVDGIGKTTKFLMIPGGHATPIEQPHETARAILEFINLCSLS